ncbi:MAG: FtsX-like permease family protein [Candidatus Omnitrophota bacterium]|jgi:lipoprotein-releasing system permease protein
MKFERFIAGKHLTHRKKTGFISLISMISVAGVGVGVMALIVVLGVMSGFDRELKSKIVNVQPHLRIEKIGGVDNPEAVIAQVEQHKIPGMKSIAGFVEGQAMIRSSENAVGVMVKGLDSSREDLSIYTKHIISGHITTEDLVFEKIKRKFLFFKKKVEERRGRVVIGESLAEHLRVRVGDEVSIIAPYRDFNKKNLSDILSLAFAETRTFVVGGIFRVGMNDFDSSLVLVDLPQAQSLYHLGERVTGIGIRFTNVDEAQKWKYVLAGDFESDYYLRSWYDMNFTFFQALKVEKSVMAILLALITLVAAFNIVSTLTMVVMEKTRDIGILRAVGATRASIRKIFLFEGFSIGSMGVAAGAVMGLLVAFNLNPISDFIKKTTGLEVFPSDIYYFDKIPVDVHIRDVAVIILFAMVAALLAGVFPAHRAAQLDPVEALRYE